MRGPRGIGLGRGGSLCLHIQIVVHGRGGVGFQQEAILIFGAPLDGVVVQVAGKMNTGLAVIAIFQGQGGQDRTGALEAITAGGGGGLLVVVRLESLKGRGDRTIGYAFQLTAQAVQAVGGGGGVVARALAQVRRGFQVSVGDGLSFAGADGSGVGGNGVGGVGEVTVGGLATGSQGRCRCGCRIRNAHRVMMIDVIHLISAGGFGWLGL